MSEYAPTIEHILKSTSLRWLFCGGKGGVGKTSSSCSIALQLAKVRENVLLISTDPAHNLSDAFGQKFGKDPRPVEGVPNLSAMEIDPSGTIEEFMRSEAANGQEIPEFLSDIAMSIPGIDEALSFAEVMKRINKQDYSIVVFDTAPTGHTLRFLQFPQILETLLGKFRDLSSKFGPMLNSFLGPQGKNIDEMLAKLDSTREIVAEANKQFKNPELTTFVCVCIAEFLSLYETERMLQDLASFEIDSNTIIVNQLLFPKANSECEQCAARFKMQQKYLEQFHELYEDFHIIELPQLKEEIRGTKALESFSEMLVEPYNPNQ